MSEELNGEGDVAVADKPKKKKAAGPKLAEGTTKAAAKGKEKTKEPKAASKKSLEGAEKPGEYGIERDHDLPWGDNKVALFKALKALKAVGKTNAKGVQELAEKADITGRDVRHYSYHAKSAGLIDVTEKGEIEGVHGYGFYLTKTGAAIDPVAEQKKEAAEKAAKAKSKPTKTDGKEGKAKAKPKVKKQMQTVEE